MQAKSRYRKKIYIDHDFKEKIKKNLQKQKPTILVY